MALLRGRCFRSSRALSWGAEDARFMETCLASVTDGGVARIGDVVDRFAAAMARTGTVALDPKDPVLTDTVRSCMAHPWHAAVVQKRDTAGKMVASFFTQPAGAGQKLSLFSSRASFERLQREQALQGTVLSAEPRSLSQMVLRDLPVMSLEMFRQRGLPEAHAVRTLALDPVPAVAVLGSTAPARASGVELPDIAFPLLRTFCESWIAAGAALQVDSLIQDKGPGAVDADLWVAVLRKTTLVAIMTSGAVFSSEAGLLLFYYPGDASKVLSFHQEQATAGLADGKVLPVEPKNLLELLRWQAGRQGNTLIVTAVICDGRAPQCHGLSITPDVCRSTEAALTSMYAPVAS